MPVPNEEPPDEAAYQFKVAVPLEAVAVKVKVPVPQRLAPDELEMVAEGFIVAVTAVLEAEVQPALVAST